MSDQLLFVLKLCLLALLYLFFFRVVRAVWAELRTPSPAAGAPAAAVPAGAAAPGRKERKAQAKAAKSRPQLVMIEPADQAGRSYPLDNEASIGRAAGCQITLDDTYSSQIHARVFLPRRPVAGRGPRLHQRHLAQPPEGVGPDGAPAR